MRKLKLDELNRLSPKQFQASKRLPVRVVLDNIRSGLNVGAFFRSADAFGLEKISLCGITPQPPHKEILKTAIGSTVSMPWIYHNSIYDHVSSLKKDGYSIIGVEQTDQSVFLTEIPLDTNEKAALVFGNEVDGISESILPLLDYAVEIRQFGTKHSLNVAVCAGIVMWEISKKLRKLGST